MNYAIGLQWQALASAADITLRVNLHTLAGTDQSAPRLLLQDRDPVEPL